MSDFGPILGGGSGGGGTGDVTSSQLANAFSRLWYDHGNTHWPAFAWMNFSEEGSEFSILNYPSSDFEVASGYIRSLDLENDMVLELLGPTGDTSNVLWSPIYLEMVVPLGSVDPALEIIVEVTNDYDNEEFQTQLGGTWRLDQTIGTRKFYRYIPDEPSALTTTLYTASCYIRLTFTAGLDYRIYSYGVAKADGTYHRHTAESVVKQLYSNEPGNLISQMTEGSDASPLTMQNLTDWLNDWRPTRQLEDAMGIIAFTAMAGFSTIAYPHTRMDIFTDDSDLSGDYDYDTDNDLISAVAPVEADAWTDTMTGNDSAGNRSYRCVISAAGISQTGTEIRVTIEGASHIDHLSIGVRDGSTANTTATPTEITFSGVSGCNVSGGQTLASDWIVFDFNDVDHILTLDINADGVVRIGTGVASYYKNHTDSWDQATVTDFSDITRIAGAIKIEVRDAWTDMAAETTVFTALDVDPNAAYCLVHAEPGASASMSDLGVAISTDNGSTQEALTLEATPILQLAGTQAIYRFEKIGLAPTGSDQVIAYFTTQNVVSEATNIKIHGYLAGLGW